MLLIGERRLIEWREAWSTFINFEQDCCPTRDPHPQLMSHVHNLYHSAVYRDRSGIGAFSGHGKTRCHSNYWNSGRDRSGINRRARLIVWPWLVACGQLGSSNRGRVRWRCSDVRIKREVKPSRASRRISSSEIFIGWSSSEGYRLTCKPLRSWFKSIKALVIYI